MRTQVAIVGGGPAGMLLAQLLHLEGIESVVIERQTRAHVLERIRAGVLEWGTVEILREAGVAERLDTEGIVHDGTAIAWAGRAEVFIDTLKFAGRRMMAYGQTMITEDLYAASDARGGTVVDQAEDVQAHGIESDSPHITWRKDGQDHRLDCDFIAGCDGFHGVCRSTIPAEHLEEFELVYPFGWLGIMSETPPYKDILYANSERGFALASMRTPTLSRYYIQCDLGDSIDDWPDDRFWRELKSRFPPGIADALIEGPSIEKSIAPLRSYVAEPMRWGRLFLAGDAAHIVPPTGAKGLNLAVADAFYLSRALSSWYRQGSSNYLDEYSDMALRRVWGAVRFSWWLTRLLHRFPNQTALEQRLQESELGYLTSSPAAMKVLCEQYAGLPFED